MRLLLDTCSCGGGDDSPRLSARARAEIVDPANEILVRTATLWEIVIKRGLGKLALADDLEDVMREEAFGLIPTSLQHLRCVETLPAVHRDPFDRMLIAQALTEGTPLITNDGSILSYGAPTIW